MRELLAAHPAKSYVERWWLLYTPVWGAITGVVMLGGFAERWGDLPCLLFGLVVAAGALVPLVRPHPTEEALPWHARTSAKLVVSVLVLSFGLNYVQTPFFVDVLHMHYGFHVRWTIDRNPIFLYLVTVAYFGTYASLCMIAQRWLRPRIGVLAWVLAPIAMAFFETVLNANPWMTRLFCYDELPFMLTFGTLVYAMSFVLVLPVWMRIEETPASRALPMQHLVIAMCAVLFVDRLMLDLVEGLIAPLFTTVIHDAPGLGPGGCLVP
jgi:cycloeucalenol cycloisomerase